MSVIRVANELYVIPKGAHVCADLDDDCGEILLAGYARDCYLYDPSQGGCPFIEGQVFARVVSVPAEQERE